jgi:hypothetical protein
MGESHLNWTTANRPSRAHPSPQCGGSGSATGPTRDGRTTPGLPAHLILYPQGPERQAKARDWDAFAPEGSVAVAVTFIPVPPTHPPD